MPRFKSRYTMQLRLNRPSRGNAKLKITPVSGWPNSEANKSPTGSMARFTNHRHDDLRGQAINRNHGGSETFHRGAAGLSVSGLTSRSSPSCFCPSKCEMRDVAIQGRGSTCRRCRAVKVRVGTNLGRRAQGWFERRNVPEPRISATLSAAEVDLMFPAKFESTGRTT